MTSLTSEGSKNKCGGAHAYFQTKCTENQSKFQHACTYTQICMWQGIVRAGPGVLEGANGKGRVLA